MSREGKARRIRELVVTGDRDGSSANSFRVRCIFSCDREPETARKMQRTRELLVELPSRSPVSSAANYRVRRALEAVQV